MVDVQGISTNTSATVRTGSSRAGLDFGAAVGQNVGNASRWRGGTQQEYASGLGNMLGKKAEEKTVRAEAAKQKPGSQNMRLFYGSNKNLPQVDYFASYREASLFELVRDRAGFSAKPWTASLSA